MQCHQVGAQGIGGVFGIDHLRQVKGVNAHIRAQAQANIATTNGIAELLVLVFGVDNNHFRAGHHTADCLELDGEGFTSTRLREHHHVGVFQAKAVKDHQAVIVHINTVQNTLFLG